MLSVTNHQPFTYPDGRIQELSEDHSRTNAVKFADYALGKFFDEARTHAFFSETIFLVMGDHGARVYCSQRFPLKSYCVPVWMMLPDGEAAGTRNATMSCSLDIAPTLLGQLGGSYRTLMFGRDATHATAEEGRALMQHNHDLALLRQDGRMTVLSLNEEPAGYHVDFHSFEVESQPADSGEVEKVVGLFQAANDLYYADRYIAGSKSSP